MPGPPFDSIREKADAVLKPRFIKYSAIVLLAAVFLYIGNSAGLQELLSQKALFSKLEKLGSFAPIGFMLIMALTVASPLPSLPLDLAAGIFFGPYLGTLYSASGALGGALISFYISRLLGRNLIERFLHGHISFCTACSDRMLTGIVFLARLVPVASFKIVSYGAGLTKMSAMRFSLATFMGMLPITFVYNSVGAALTVDRRLAMIFGIMLVLLFLLIPTWLERYAPEKFRSMFRHSQQAE